MYCSSCGAALPPGLSYCNRCGAGLSAKEAKTAGMLALPESLVWAVVSVSVGGLAVLIGMMAMMKEALNFSTQLITVFALLGFLLLLGAESVFIWLLVRRGKALSGAQDSGYPTQFSGPVTRELSEERTPIEPAMSVTEHTTHTLEPIPRERKT
ncbi:MAG: zinc ribbon domain-containing protein [Pyrinomonadaceae bacterium]